MHMQVWVVNLILYSTLPKDINVGEAWMNPASWIQLFGFSLLLAGTIIYAQVGSPVPISWQACLIVHHMTSPLKEQGQCSRFQ